MNDLPCVRRYATFGPVFSIALALLVTPARAETTPCSPTWIPEAMPSTLLDAPVLPTVMLPLAPTYYFGSDIDYTLIVVDARDADGVAIAGEVFPGGIVADDVPTAVWRPAAPLTPGATYTLAYAATSQYGCGAPLEGTLSLTVAHVPRPLPTLDVSATFVDTQFSSSSGLSRSCGPGATACEGRPGICCVRTDRSTMRSLQFVIRGSFDYTMDPYYRVTMVPKSVELGTWVQRLMFFGAIATAGNAYQTPFDAGPPAEGEGCVDLVFEDLMAQVTLATLPVCADGHSEIADTACLDQCQFGLDPLSEPVSEADPTAESSIAEPDVRGDGPEDGCAGGSAGLIGLLGIALGCVLRPLSKAV